MAITDYNEVYELYNKEFPSDMPFVDISSKLAKMTDNNVDKYRVALCNNLLYAISGGYTKYADMDFSKNNLIQLFVGNAALLPKSEKYFHAARAFFIRDKHAFMDLVKQFLADDYASAKDEGRGFDEFSLVDLFIEPFKEAFDGFWSELGQMLKKYPVQTGITELCGIIDKFYKCKTDDEAAELLLDVIQKYPDLVVPKELLGFTYQNMKMWNNAIAYYETVEDNSLFLVPPLLYFQMAWCYGKIKNTKLEELYYRKSLELHPSGVNVLNNLGYCLYKQKRFVEAKEIFEQCLEEKRDLDFAGNNYVRVLIALGRNRDAKEFVKAGKFKVAKELKNRVAKLDDTNARIKKTDIVADVILDEDDDAVQENKIDLGIKRQQFSNEKLLEDELTARIESGMEVFGMKLKMYKRKGMYGRQFRIPVGRLDLLCEDDAGDLYVIELKKGCGI